MSVEQDADTARTVAAVNLKLPPFWPSDPDVWFTQVEAQFSMHGITAQKTKCDYVVASLSPEFATEVRHLILHVPADPYDTLKQQLIKRTSLPEQHRLQQLFHSMELGDRKPTQLLCQMQQLLGDNETATYGTLLHEPFLQRLPSNVRMVLASSSDAKSLEDIAQLADKIVNIEPPSMSSPSTTEVDSLRAEVTHLKELVSTLYPRGRSSRSVRHRPNATLDLTHHLPRSLVFAGIMPALETEP